MHSTRKREMSLSETYVLAHTARAKLTREAARADHQLRLLVGHANMLDNLMLDLAEAEREREAWYNQTIRSRTTTAATTTTTTSTSTSTTPIAPALVSGKRIQWLDTVVRHEEPDSDDDDEENWDGSSDSDSDDSSDYETDGDFFVDITAKQTTYPAAAAAGLYPIKYSPATTATSKVHARADFDLSLAEEEEYDDYDDYDDGDDLTLTRTSSRQHQPPELLHDSDEESEDDMPPSPPQTTFDSFSASHESGEALVSAASSASEKGAGKGIHADQTPSPRLSAEEQSSFVEEGFFLPARNPARTQAMIAAF